MPTQPRPPFRLCIHSFLCALLSSAFYLCWAILPSNPIEERCANLSTFQAFFSSNNCFRNSDGLFFVALLSGIIAAICLLIAVATTKRQKIAAAKANEEERQRTATFWANNPQPPRIAAYAEQIRLENRRAAAHDEERNVGISTPPPAYDPVSSSSSSSPHDPPYFTPVLDSTSSASYTLPPLYQPGSTSHTPDLSTVYAPVRVSFDGEENVNDWRGKWNAKVGTMKGRTW